MQLVQGRFGGAALAGGGGGGIYQMDTLNLAGFLNLTNASFDLEAYCVICVDHKLKKKVPKHNQIDQYAEYTPGKD